MLSFSAVLICVLLWRSQSRSSLWEYFYLKNITLLIGILPKIFQAEELCVIDLCLVTPVPTSHRHTNGAVCHLRLLLSTLTQPFLLPAATSANTSMCNIWPTKFSLNPCLGLGLLLHDLVWNSLCAGVFPLFSFIWVAECCFVSARHSTRMFCPVACFLVSVVGVSWILLVTFSFLC